jgi:hypothetical protein
VSGCDHPTLRTGDSFDQLATLSSCLFCERDRLREEVERLTKALRIAELKASGSLANNLCPDHRDKQTGKPCLACEIERLQGLLGMVSESRQRLLDKALDYDRMRAALKALTDAVASTRVPQTIEDAALQVTVTIGPALTFAQDALVETFDARDPLDAWSDMDSAPKDGARILALVTKEQFYLGTETPNELIPVVVRWAGEYSEWSMPGIGGLRLTLWQPIKLSVESIPGGADTREDSVRQARDTPCDATAKFFGEP